ncbi:MAG: hypothetical protein SGILL_009785 [Bacillariaceae sp.]
MTDDFVDFEPDTWISISANKNGYGNIQVDVVNTDGCETEFNLCDGIAQAGKCCCSNIYKSDCDGRYVFYPTSKKMCKAVKDDDDNVVLASYDDDGNLEYDADGNVVLDSVNGKPYGECSSCNKQSYTRNLRRVQKQFPY